MLEAFWLSLGMVFLAELGDKTQLVALCLASRFKAKTVLGGILCATLVVHVISVILGGGLAKMVPPEWIKLAAGLAFIGFGLWTLRGDCLSDEECNAMQGRSPFWLVFTTFFLAELGDKTMLSTVTLATTHPIIPVWIGSSLGMVISDGLAIWVGQMLGKRLPERAVRVGASIVFFAFGALSVTQGCLNLPAYAWLIGVGTSAIMVAAYSVTARRARKAAALPLAEQDEAAEPALVESGDRRA